MSRQKYQAWMYRLLPRPVARHHVTVLLLLAIEFLISHIVNLAFKIRMSEEVFDDVARVPIPDVVAHSLPLWRTSRFGERAVILQVNTFPLDIAHLDRVNLAMEIPVVGNRRSVTMGNECGSP